MTREDVIEILARFVIGAKPCSQREIIDACASAYEMLKEQPSLPSNLNEAAKTHAQIEGDEEYGRYNIEKYEDFKAGAEWMAGRGKTVEGYISLRGKRSLITVLDKLEEFKFADKVIVQIRKEQ